MNYIKSDYGYPSKQKATNKPKVWVVRNRIKTRGSQYGGSEGVTSRSETTDGYQTGPIRSNLKYNDIVYGVPGVNMVLATSKNRGNYKGVTAGYNNSFNLKPTKRHLSNISLYGAF